MVPSSAERYPSSRFGVPGEPERLPRVRGVGHSGGEGEGEAEMECDRDPFLRSPGEGSFGDSTDSVDPMAQTRGLSEWRFCPVLECL